MSNSAAEAPGRRTRWLVAVVAVPAVVLSLLAQHPGPAPPIVAVAAPVVDAAPAQPPASAAEEVDAAKERCTEEAYLARLAEGRRALAKKRFEEAREALDLALYCRFDDPAALSERGYSFYLSGDPAKARRDLAIAARGAKEPALLATIWFRRGLADAQLTDPNVAKRAFATSVAFGGGQAARDKLEGEDVCAVTVERYGPGRLRWIDRNSEHKANSAPSVAALFSGLDGFDDPVDTDDAAWEKAVVERRSLPAAIELRGAGVTGHWFVAKGRTSLWAFELGVLGRFYFFIGKAQFDVSTRDDGLIRAHGHHADLREIVNEEGRPGASADGLVTAVDAYFDPKRELALVVRSLLPGQFEERSDVPAPKVHVTRKGVVVRGLGCDLTEPWEDAPLDAGGLERVADATPGDGASPTDAGRARATDAAPPGPP